MRSTISWNDSKTMSTHAAALSSARKQKKRQVNNMLCSPVTTEHVISIGKYNIFLEDIAHQRWE